MHSFGAWESGSQKLVFQACYVTSWNSIIQTVRYRKVWSLMINRWMVPKISVYSNRRRWQTYLRLHFEVNHWDARVCPCFAYGFDTMSHNKPAERERERELKDLKIVKRLNIFINTYLQVLKVSVRRIFTQ